ncbi:metal-dependent phosphohydrolase [Actinomycetes bacterium KLBMP 9797]
MTVLSPPRHPLIDKALRHAQEWCLGRVVDDRPAIQHAARVAVTLSRHVPTVGPELVAAVLLHDSPEFAPADVDLDALVTTEYGPEVRRIVRSMEAEHAALDEPDPTIRTGDRPLLLACTADQIVAFKSLAQRARRSGDVNSFFAARPALLRLLPHFRAYQLAGVGLVPFTMSDHLDIVLTVLERMTGPAHAAVAR